jgi:hypothetical protein
VDSEHKNTDKQFEYESQPIVMIVLIRLFNYSQRGKIDSKVDAELKLAYSGDLNIKKISRNDGSYLFGSRLMKCEVRGDEVGL